MTIDHIPEQQLRRSMAATYDRGGLPAVQQERARLERLALYYRQTGGHGNGFTRTLALLRDIEADYQHAEAQDV